MLSLTIFGENIKLECSGEGETFFNASYDEIFFLKGLQILGMRGGGRWF